MARRTFPRPKPVTTVTMPAEVLEKQWRAVLIGRGFDPRQVRISSPPGPVALQPGLIAVRAA